MIKKYQNWPTIKKMILLQSIFSLFLLIGFILIIALTVSEMNFLAWYNNYIKSHQINALRIDEDGTRRMFICVACFAIAIAGTLWALGWIWIARSYKRNVSPKPVYFLVLAIIATVGIAIIIVLLATGYWQLKLSFKNDIVFTDVEKDEITKHWDEIHLEPLSYFGFASSIVQTAIYWFLWILGKKRKSELWVLFSTEQISI